jgi:hypothetical protein
MWKIKMDLEEELQTTKLELQTTELELQTAEQEDNYNFEVVVADQAKARFLKEMIKVLKDMKNKFIKYWNKSHITLCVPMVFDPRFKLKFVDFVFNKVFPKIGKEKD